MKNRKLQNLIGGLALAFAICLSVSAGGIAAQAVEISDEAQVQEGQVVVLEDDSAGEDDSDDTADEDSQTGSGDSSAILLYASAEKQESTYILKNKKLVDETTGAAFTGTGFAKVGDVYYYVVNGTWASSCTDIIKVENVETAKGEWWYVKGGIADFTVNSVEKNANGWWYLKNGKVDFTYSGVAKNANGWWRIENGKVNFGYTGFAKNANGWWYCENGKVTFKTNSVKKGTVNGESGWWYVVKSQVIFTDTVAHNENGWWCIENGKVNFECNSIDENENGWWKIKNGKVDFSFTGLAQNKNGWWYCKGGKVRFDVTSVIKGTVNGESGWWYVSGGKVNLSYNGVGVNENGAWLIENGKVNFDFTGTKTFNGLTYTFTNGRTYDYLDGWQVIDGNSYYYKDGVRLTNCVADGYKLDSNGCSSTRALVLSLVNSCTNDSMSNDQKIQAIWNWLIGNSWTYTRTYEHTSSSWVWYSGWTDDFAKQCIQNKTGNCFRYAAVFGYMVKEATGYEVRVYHGSTKRTGGGTTPHGWVTVNIGGTWYAYDPDLAKFGTNRSTYYKTPYSQTSKSIHLSGVAVNLY